MIVQVSTAEETPVLAFSDLCPDGYHKCIAVKVGMEQTKLDAVSARSLIVGLEGIVVEVETRNDEIGEDTND